MDLIVDSLAAWRITHLIIEDHFPPVEKAREAIRAKVDVDSSIAYLLTCPYCVGVYAATGIVLARRLLPKQWRPVAEMLAVAAIVPFVENFDSRVK